MRWFLRQSWIPFRVKLNFYPPFIGLAARVRAHSRGMLEMEIRPRFRNRNHHGTLFGGAIGAVSDPLPALVISEAIPGVEVWSARVLVEFLKPAKGRVTARVEISETHLQELKIRLDAEGQIRERFEFRWVDEQKSVIARVENDVFARNRRIALD